MWIHENEHWPKFDCDEKRHRPQLDRLRARIDEWNESDAVSLQTEFYRDLETMLKAAGGRVKKALQRLEQSGEFNSYAEAAYRTSLLENAIIDDEADRAAIRRDVAAAMRMSRRKRTSRTELAGTIDMVLDANSNKETLTENRLRGWQLGIFEREPHAGRYRIGPAEVRRTAGGESETVYEAPADGRVPELMRRLVAWLNDDSVDGLLRAALGHLVYEQIHPFADGNGRTGRALCDQLLGRMNRRPMMFHNITAQMEQESADYYRMLRQCGECGRPDAPVPVDDWVEWFLLCLERSMTFAADFAAAAADRIKVLTHAKLCDINDRQMEAVCSMLEPDWHGELVNSRYAKMCGGLDRRAATKDLAGLVDAGILRRHGERRGAAYRLAEWKDIRQHRNTGTRHVETKAPAADETAQNPGGLFRKVA